VPLLDENGSHPLLPELLDSRKNSQLVVYDHIMRRWVTGLYIRQFVLLMYVDQGAPVDCFMKARAAYLTRLEDDVAVGEQDGNAPLLDALDRIEGTRIKAVGKRIVDEEVRYVQKSQVVGIFDSKALQGAQVFWQGQAGVEFSFPFLMGCSVSEKYCANLIPRSSDGNREREAPVAGRIMGDLQIAKGNCNLRWTTCVDYCRIVLDRLWSRTSTNSSRFARSRTNNRQLATWPDSCC
jgi:hypothetical protein